MYMLKYILKRIGLMLVTFTIIFVMCFVLIKLLPVDTDQFEASDLEGETLMSYEPGEAEVLDALIPLYMNSLIYGALVESTASENGARMQAMDSATSNAQEMMEHLSLQYNRARQASITQEITEIIAGANAIE